MLKLSDVIPIVIIFALIFSMLNIKAQSVSYVKQISGLESEIIALNSEIDYLNFTIENRITLEEVENRAINQLGMVKIDSNQKIYVQLEDENDFEVYESPVAIQIEEIITPLIIFLTEK